MGHPGRYDRISVRVLEETEAKAVVLIVIEGKLGFGMSVSVRPSAAPEVNLLVPALLPKLADAIERQVVPDGVRLTSEEEGN